MKYHRDGIRLSRHGCMTDIRIYEDYISLGQNVALTVLINLNLTAEKDQQLDILVPVVFIISDVVRILLQVQGISFILIFSKRFQ
jgi:hypothetical protein